MSTTLAIVIVGLIALVVLLLIGSVRLVQQYQPGIVFRFGRVSDVVRDHRAVDRRNTVNPP